MSGMVKLLLKNWMNANPFTLGHLYLIEKAASESDFLHLFMVSEEMSLIPFSVRKQLILEGTAHIENIIYHETGDYLISSATFPSYFLKDDDKVSLNHGKLDAEIFVKIAQVLDISTRYVGEENFSVVTNLYNKALAETLLKNNISLQVIKRKALNSKEISASTVRLALKNQDFNALKDLAPFTTRSEERRVGKEC